MKAFLTMKHWQLFLLVFGIPLIGSFIIMLVLIMSGNFAAIMIGIIILNFISISVLIAWQYTLVYNLSKLFPPGETMNMNMFKICLIVPIGIVFVLFYFMSGVVLKPDWFVSFDFRWMILILPMVLVSMACSIYVLYVMSKSIVTVEQQRHVEFGDFILEFILLWFWIVGIWILQPRINAIFDRPYNSGAMPPPIMRT